MHGCVTISMFFNSDPPLVMCTLIILKGSHLDFPITLNSISFYAFLCVIRLVHDWLSMPRVGSG